MPEFKAYFDTSDFIGSGVGTRLTSPGEEMGAGVPDGAHTVNTCDATTKKGKKIGTLTTSTTTWTQSTTRTPIIRPTDNSLFNFKDSRGNSFGITIQNADFLGFSTLPVDTTKNVAGTFTFADNSTIGLGSRVIVQLKNQRSGGRAILRLKIETSLLENRPQPLVVFD